MRVGQFLVVCGSFCFMYFVWEMGVCYYFYQKWEWNEDGLFNLDDLIRRM